MPRRSLFLRIFAAVGIGVTAVLYVALILDSFRNDGKPLTTLQPAGPNAQAIQTLVGPVFAIAGVVFLIVFAVSFYVFWRFRAKPDGTDEDYFPEQVHGKTVLEVGWTILPALILAGVAVGTVVTILRLEDRGPNPIEVRVYGAQWWWGYQYDGNGDGDFDDPEDFHTANEMVIPIDTEVLLIQTSYDVIHSHWFPALNGKRDAVPGQTTYNELHADELGVYLGQCTEYCGLSHANMRKVVRVVDQATYDEWFRNQVAPPPVPADGTLAAEGASQFGNLCAQCHVVRGQFERALDEPPPLVAGIAPDLSHFATRGTFGGSIFNLYAPQAPGQPFPTPGDPLNVSLPGEPAGALTGGSSSPFELNRPTLEAWLRNPPAMKPAFPDGQRGMPNLGLTEEQIDQLVAYLETLK